MIEYDLDREHAVLHVRPQGALEQEDFQRMARTVDPYIETEGRLTGVVIETPSFPGWESFGAMIEHFRFIRDHHKEVDRVALVTDSPLGTVADKVTDHFIGADVRQFDATDREAAFSWVLDQP